jgi:hypothetical protein
MITTQFSRLAGFGAIFSEANYSSLHKDKPSFLQATRRVIPQVLRYKLR